MPQAASRYSGAPARRALDIAPVPGYCADMLKKFLIPAAFALAFVLMAAGSLVRISSGIPPGAALSAQEKSLLAQAIPRPVAEGRYNVVSPTSSADFLLGNDAASTDAKKQALIAAFGKQGHAVSALVERLYQRNAGQPNAMGAPLPLESALAQGYLIDDGTYAAYFRPGGGGWGKLQEDHPQASVMLRLTLPVYDEGSELFMVGIDARKSGMDNTYGAGVALYKFENGALRQLDIVPLREIPGVPR